MKTDAARMSTKKMRSDPPESAQPKNRNGVPAYQRIQSAIRKRIDSGQLQPGDAVASERDLAKIHQVQPDDRPPRARLARTRRCRGATPRHRNVRGAPKIHFNKLMSYTEQMAAAA